MSTSPLEFDSIIIPKVRGSSFLDIGSGYGKWGFLLKKYFWQISGDSVSSPFVAGLDIFMPHLLSLKTMNIYDLLIKANAPRLPFKDNSFDTVLAIELLEHTDKENGARLLGELKRVAKLRAIVTTPNFKDFRDGLTGLDGYNPHEKHSSYWTVSELKKHNFDCLGTGIRFSSSYILNKVLHSLTYKLPRLSRYIIGVHYKNDR